MQKCICLTKGHWPNHLCLCALQNRRKFKAKPQESAWMKYWEQWHTRLRSSSFFVSFFKHSSCFQEHQRGLVSIFDGVSHCVLAGNNHQMLLKCTLERLSCVCVWYTIQNPTVDGELLLSNYERKRDKQKKSDTAIARYLNTMKKGNAVFKIRTSYHQSASVQGHDLPWWVLARYFFLHSLVSK